MMLGFFTLAGIKLSIEIVCADCIQVYTIYYSVADYIQELFDAVLYCSGFEGNAATLVYIN